MDERPRGAVRSPVNAAVHEHAVAVLVGRAGPRPAAVGGARQIDMRPEQFTVGQRPARSDDLLDCRDEIAGRCRRAGATRRSRRGKQQRDASAEELGNLGLRRRRDGAELAGGATDVVDCGWSWAAIGDDRGGPLERIVGVGGELVAGPVELVGRVGRGR